MKKPKSFIFLGDIIKTNIKEPIEIIPNYFIKKAEDKQIDLIKEQLAYLPFLGVQFFQYETIGKQTRTKLNREDWNYWIIEYNENTFKTNILNAISLAGIDLNIFFEMRVASVLSAKKVIKNYILNPIYFIPSPLSMFLYFFDDLFNKETTEITSNYITEVRNILSIKEKYDKVKNDYSFINDALFDFMMLKTISKKSPFRLVAFFSILEMLLTHPPKNIDDDSLSRQLRTKINLLNNRCEQKILRVSGWELIYDAEKTILLILKQLNKEIYNKA